jgi:hypothetical protein
MTDKTLWDALDSPEMPGPGYDHQTRPIFGRADPKDYMEPLCTCGHVYDEHYNGQGTHEDMDPCWADWHDDVEGCQCLGWSEPHEHQPDRITMKSGEVWITCRTCGRRLR